MNYLAHLALSFDDPSLMLGNFIADEIRSSEMAQLSESVQLGVYLHREIDAFTDGHRCFTAAVKSIKKYHPKYAPVIIDIANDHFLSCRWEEYFDRSFLDFADHVYAVLPDVADGVSGRALRHVSALLQHKYLYVYAQKEGLKGVMTRMDDRASFPSGFALSVDHLWEEYEFYDEQFHVLMSELLVELPRLLERAQLTLEMKRNGKGSTQ